MTETRTSRRSKEKLERKAATLTRAKRTIAGMALAATLAGVVPTAVAPMAFAITSENISPSDPQGIISAPTLKDIFHTQVEGNNRLTIAAYRQAGTNQSMKAELAPKKVAKNATAEKQAWDKAEAEAEFYGTNIFNPISKEQGLWDSGSDDISPSEDGTELVITFKADGSTRTYSSMEAILKAKAGSQARWESALAEKERLDDLAAEAEAAYLSASAEVDSSTDFTLKLIAEGNYENKVFSVDATVLDGDTFTANVVSNVAGTLILDVTFNQPLTSAIVPTVNFTDVALPVVPGKAVADRYSFTWDGEEKFVQPTHNDVAAEGYNLIPESLILRDPKTGARTTYLTKPYGTLRSVADGIYINQNREATAEDVIEYEISDTSGNTYRGTFDLSLTGEIPWTPTVATDTSKIDMSDSSKFYQVFRNTTSYIPKDIAKSGNFSPLHGWISAPAPSGFDEIITVPRGTNLAIDPFININAGNTRDPHFDYDLFAQDEVPVKNSLQAGNTKTGQKAGPDGSGFTGKGMDDVTVIPSTGSAGASPVTTSGDETAPAANKYDTPYIAIKADRSYLGEADVVEARMFTAAYGETFTDAEVRAFWEAYDRDGTGKERVITKKVYVRYDKIDLTKGYSLPGRAAELNGPTNIESSPVFDRNRYTHYGNTTGGGSKSPLVGIATDDFATTKPGVPVSIPVTDNDIASRQAANSFYAYVGAKSASKPFGFRAADGSLVPELEVEGGKWVINIHSVSDVENYAYAVPVGKPADVTWVNQSLKEATEGITIKASDAQSAYVIDESKTAILTDDGKLVSDYTVPEVGTWKVSPDTAPVFVPAAGFKGTAKLHYSALDKWVGSPEQQQAANYDLVAKPYGSELIGTITVTVTDEEVPTPDLPEEPPVSEETPDEPLPYEPPVTDENEDPEIPPVKETPGDDPEEVPTPEDNPGPDSSEEKEPKGDDPQLTTIPEQPTPSKEPGSSTTVRTPLETAGSSAKESDPLAETGNPIPMTLFGGGLLTILGGLVLGRRSKGKHLKTAS